MKTAASVPDDLFEEADELAARLHTSRSRVFAEALREYLDRHSPQRTTEAMNTAVEEVGEESDNFLDAASRALLEDNEW
ncbi:MAG: ribbon-helix-helix protein, CopG family [Spirochaetes bacterium]|jgi:metal-responsive CopG/Arc/MetJ family transcriptional regulator|nr:ribbon-helix-helix protein, CopG family [Spirochaetota bacterium]